MYSETRMETIVFSYFCPSILLLYAGIYSIHSRQDGLQLPYKELVCAPTFFYVLLPFTL